MNVDSLQQGQSQDVAAPSIDMATITRRLSLTLAGLCVLVGIFLHFYKLDNRELWYDEVIHYSVALGHSEHLVAGGKRLFTNEEVRARLQPNVNASVPQVLEASARFSHWHPPTFDLLEYFWLRAVGATTWTARALPALLGLLMIPAAYLLAFECSRNRLAGAWAAALVAMSPFCVTYSQEINGYSLAMGLVILSHALFLRALRKHSILWWCLYVATTTAAFFISYQTVWALVCQSAYALVVSRNKWKRLIAPVVAFGATVGLASPVFLYLHRLQAAWLPAIAWLTKSTPALWYTLACILSYTAVGLVEFKSPGFDPTFALSRCCEHRIRHHLVRFDLLLAIILALALSADLHGSERAAHVRR
jgi:uncharacterized membrane protein